MATAHKITSVKEIPFKGKMLGQAPVTFEAAEQRARQADQDVYWLEPTKTMFYEPQAVNNAGQ